MRMKSKVFHGMQIRTSVNLTVQIEYLVKIPWDKKQEILDLALRKNPRPLVAFFDLNKEDQWDVFLAPRKSLDDTDFLVFRERTYGQTFRFEVIKYVSMMESLDDLAIDSTPSGNSPYP